MRAAPRSLATRKDWRSRSGSLRTTRARSATRVARRRTFTSRGRSARRAERGRSSRGSSTRTRRSRTASRGSSRWEASSSRSGYDDDPVALRLEQLGGAARLALAGHEHLERAAAFRRHVAELEVLDVDALGAESLRDAGEHARPVRDVDAQPVQVAGICRIRALEHAPAVADRLADPAGDEPGVAGGERSLEVLDPAAVLGQRSPQLGGVVGEDVGPDARIRARY